MVKKYIDIFNRKLCALFANPVSPGWGSWSAGGKLNFIQSEQFRGKFLNRKTDHSSLPWVGFFFWGIGISLLKSRTFGENLDYLVTLAFKNIGQHLLVCQALY